MSNGLSVSSSIESRLSEIKDLLGCSELELRLSDAWGSFAPDSRIAIRATLSALTGESHFDLEAPPKSERFGISISHCSSLGGFAVVPRPARIGFDIEIAERVSEALAARISRPGELKHAPSIALLWAAKEAAFKSLAGPTQPKIFTEVMTESWLKFRQPLELEGKAHEVWKFHASVSQTESIDGHGIAFGFSKFALALFCSR